MVLDGMERYYQSFLLILFFYPYAVETGRNVSQYVNFMKRNYPAGFSYQEFANDFTAEFFDPDQWAELFNKSGAR